LHQLSPSSSGLFHSIIAESGTPISTLILLGKHPSYFALSLAKQLGCKVEDSKTEDFQNVKDCLMKANLEKMMWISNPGNMFHLLPMPFKPVVDGVMKGVKVILFCVSLIMER